MKTLITLASAGMLASTAFAGGLSDSRIDRHSNSAAMVPAQYYAQRDDRPQYYAQQDDRAAAINERESRITERIQRGMNDGRITDREARRLQRELDAIQAKERAFKDDGRLSRRETDELNRDLSRLADHVRQQMRDEQRY
jgi:hypothetical protein